MKLFQGMFGLLGGGSLIASVAFIGEWIYYLYHKRGNLNVGKKKWAVRRKKVESKTLRMKAWNFMREFKLAGSNIDQLNCLCVYLCHEKWLEIMFVWKNCVSIAVWSLFSLIIIQFLSIKPNKSLVNLIKSVVFLFTTQEGFLDFWAFQELEICGFTVVKILPQLVRL